MKYTNDKIKQLLAERNATIEKYNLEIQREIEKEQAKYQFSWKRFLLTVGAIVFMVAAVQLNKRIFPETSVWSWKYYMSDKPRSTAH